MKKALVLSATSAPKSLLLQKNIRDLVAADKQRLLEMQREQEAAPPDETKED